MTKYVPYTIVGMKKYGKFLGNLPAEIIALYSFLKLSIVKPVFTFKRF